MNNEPYKRLQDMVNIVRNIREKLPDISIEDITILADDFSDLNLDTYSQEEAKKIHNLFTDLSNEITGIMTALDQYCDELRQKVDKVNDHKVAAKAYIKASVIN